MKASDFNGLQVVTPPAQHAYPHALIHSTSHVQPKQIPEIPSTDFLTVLSDDLFLILACSLAPSVTLQISSIIQQIICFIFANLSSHPNISSKVGIFVTLCSLLYS